MKNTAFLLLGIGMLSLLSCTDDPPVFDTSLFSPSENMAISLIKR